MDKLLVILGPTGSGKSTLGMELAKKFNGEIINADSRSVYRYMDIGTAKPTQNDMLLIPHHLVDIKNPDEHFSVADFKLLANATIEKIAKRGNLPIMVGGTGLYIDSVLFDYQFETHTMADAMRSNTLVIGIKPANKESMRERIEQRAKKMLEEGIIDEVRTVTERYGWNNKSMSGTIFRAFKDVVLGHKTPAEGLADSIRNDMMFAKKQMTWFKRHSEIQWISEPTEAELLVKLFL